MDYETWLKESGIGPGSLPSYVRGLYESGLSPGEARQHILDWGAPINPDYEPPASRRGRPPVVFTKAMLKRIMLQGALKALAPYHGKKIAPADKAWFLATLDRMTKALDQS